jgi:hypothetical protein
LPIAIHNEGSGVSADGTTLVSVDGSVGLVVPSRFTFTVAAKPSVESVVRAGIVPAGSENMLKANALREVDTPSGELTAGRKDLSRTITSFVSEILDSALTPGLTSLCSRSCFASTEFFPGLR